MDTKLLDQQYRIIQKTVHPDRFINATDLEQKQSLHKSTQINNAYQTLKNPIQRASYIIRLYFKGKENTLPSDFLMQQMQWEEELEEVNNLEVLQTFMRKIKSENILLMNLLIVHLDEKKAWESALQILGKIKFITNLLSKIQKKIFTISDS